MKKIFGLVVCLVFMISMPVFADFDKGWKAYQNGDYETALREWQPLAEQGHIEAQFNLGVLYDKGWGVSQDYKQAIKWYKLSAAQGDARARFVLGGIYYYGQGVSQDYEEATKWFKLAAEQGYASAQFALGGIYRFGWGVQKNYTEAIKWFKPSAEQGHAEAQYNLGRMYYYGQGVSQDYVRAYMWINLSNSNTNKNDIEQPLLGKAISFWGYVTSYLVQIRMTDEQIAEAKILEKRCVAKNYKWC